MSTKTNESEGGKASTATYALLGLLGVQSWTGYELASQAHRSLRYIWPTSEAHLYREQKRLVRMGWATAEPEHVGRRQRMRYSITEEGRAAFREWAATEPQPPGFEVEGIVRAFFGDFASVESLETSMRATSRLAQERLDDMLDFVDDYLETGGPFPHRLHVVSLTIEIITEMLSSMATYFDRAADEVAEWDTTVDRGIDDQTRARLERVRDRYRPRS